MYVYTKETRQNNEGPRRNQACCEGIKGHLTRMMLIVMDRHGRAINIPELRKGGGGMGT
jgi:hypothetical protein